MSKAVALLDEGRSTLGDGLGFGPGPSVTFTGRNGGTFTMGENERYVDSSGCRHSGLRLMGTLTIVEIEWFRQRLAYDDDGYLTMNEKQWS